MSKKAITVDISTGKKKLEVVIDDYENAQGREDVAYSAKAVDDLLKDSSIQLSTKEW